MKKKESPLLSGYQIYVPKSIIEILGEPEVIDFVVNGKKIEVRPHKD